MTVFLRLRLLLVLSLLLPTGLPVFAQGVGTMYGNSGFPTQPHQSCPAA